MCPSESARTKMLLDILFPPKESIFDPADHPFCGGMPQEEEDSDLFITFMYANRKTGKLKEWTVNIERAVYFNFNSTNYMVIRGDFGGPVCFNLSKAFYRTTGERVIGVAGASAVLDEFPSEKMQTWMLQLKNL
jgi:hypothetical protein